MLTAASHTQPLVIGLTGGIGSGKTTVANGFGNLGVPLIDADLIARELVEPGQAALEEIRAVFGPGCLTADGRLDRAHIQQRIFANESLRLRLEAILHPEIRKRIKALIADVRTAYCIVVIPLLLETGQKPQETSCHTMQSSGSCTHRQTGKHDSQALMILLLTIAIWKH
jgi:dephospho-CoA kinase